MQRFCVYNLLDMIDWSQPDTIPTLELIEYISWKGQGDEETEEAGKRAFGIFYGRFSKDISQKCEILCNRYGYDSSDALMLVEKTFSKFISSNKFNVIKCKTQDVNLCVKLYLFQISKFLLIDNYRERIGIRGNDKYNNYELVHEIEEMDAFQNGIPNEGKLRDVYELLKHALSGLSEKQKLIYLTYKNAGKSKGEQSKHLLSLLSEATGLSKGTIRSYYNRAKEIVEAVTKVYVKEK